MRQLLEGAALRRSRGDGAASPPAVLATSLLSLGFSFTPGQSLSEIGSF